MDASERKKAVNEMVDKERELYTTVKTENEFLKIVLKLATKQEDHVRLGKMLYNLQIGNKRDYNKDLKGYIKGNGNLKTTHKEAFYELIEENEEIYKQIQETICEKLGYTESEIEEARIEKEKSKELGVEDPRGIESDEDLNKEKIITSLLGRKANAIDTKNSMDDFKAKQVKLNLKSSLTSIKTSLEEIENNLKHIDISRMQPDSEDTKVLAYLVKRTKVSSAKWLEYLVTQKVNKKFMLYEDNLLELFNGTIEPAKRTWEIASMMEKQMIEAGLTTEEIQKRDEKDVPQEIKDADFNMTPYWSDSVVRNSQINREVQQDQVDATYSGNPVYEKDKKTYLKYKYFDDVSRTEKDIEKARRGQGLDFKVKKGEIRRSNMLRQVLRIWNKVPEETRDFVDKATKSFGLRGNGFATAAIAFFVGRASKDPEDVFPGGGGPSSRERHRRFTEEMGGPESGPGGGPDGGPERDPDREPEEHTDRDSEDRSDGEGIEP